MSSALTPYIPGAFGSKTATPKHTAHGRLARRLFKDALILRRIKRRKKTPRQ